MTTTAPHKELTVFMDSGPAATRRPGMTGVRPRRHAGGQGEDDVTLRQILQFECEIFAIAVHDLSEHAPTQD
ncbi:hypothetical protein [Chelatococcus asaccharovorans]|uniref:hypothetical protein n=1 Tax=Chelatococcus asaccharovorans TaxID=28210 RepID=UPI000D7730FC|nr:hypothetical protein [Chelatococcus asaccharovorans]